MRTIVIPLAAGLLAACATSRPIEPQLAPASVDFSAAATQRVELSNFDFTPREIRLQAGRPYRLELANVASGGHDFAAPDFFAAARIRADDAAQVASGNVEVPGGSTRTVHLVPAVGEYRLVCTHTGHALFGMTGTIIVE